MNLCTVDYMLVAIKPDRISKSCLQTILAPSEQEPLLPLIIILISYVLYTYWVSIKKKHTGSYCDWLKRVWTISVKADYMLVSLLENLSVMCDKASDCWNVGFWLCNFDGH